MAAGPVYAQGTPSAFDAKGFQENRDYFSGAPSEYIDTISGNVVLTHTDLVLPGNAGRELRFVRTFNAKDGRWIFGVKGLPGLTEGANPDVPAIFTDETGADLKAIVFARDPSSTPPDRWLATSRFWKYDRVTRVLYLPDGTLVQYDAQRRPVAVWDAFAPLVTVSYPPQCQVATCIRQELGNGQFREVRLNAPLNEPAGGFPTTMTYAPGDGSPERVWSYTLNAPVFGLTAVTPPAGPGWGYAYEGAPGSATYNVEMTNPFGGVTRYEFQNHRWFLRQGGPGCQECLIETFDMPVIHYRRVGVGPSAPTWTYTFDFGVGEAATVSYVTTMHSSVDGALTTFSYTGNEAGTNFPGAPSLLLKRKIIRNAASAIEQQEDYQYEDVPAPAQAVPFVQYYTPETTRREVRRDGRTYVTESLFAPSNFGDYHQPYRTIESGEVSRTTNRSFLHTPEHGFLYTDSPLAPSPMFLAPMDGEWVEVDGPVVSRTWSHNPATNFVTRQTEYGITTTFEPDAFGNVKTSTLGDETKTQFTYDWGVLRNTQTALHTLAQQINPDGTVASRTLGGRTTEYTWDARGRITRVKPPGNGDDIVTDYPDPNHVVVTRGPSVTTVTLDGFGRTVLVQGPSSMSRTAYDADGRKVYESYPYSATDIGVTVQYDALGRVTRRINPDATEVRYTYEPGAVSIRDENGRTTRQEWDGFGSPDDKRLKAVVDAAGSRWSYRYNTLGALTRVDAPGGLIREWQYQHAGRPALLSAEVHPESGTTSYTHYDQAGRLRRKVDAKGTVFTYEYDTNGRPDRITAGDRVTTYRYEAGTDNRASASVDGVTTSWGYDAAGRLASRIDTISGEPQMSQGFQYDGRDNLVRADYASGGRVQFDYNAANQVSQVTDITDPAAPTIFANQFEYHPSGALTRYRTANNLVHLMEFHPLRYWPTRIQAGTFELTYADYDAVGNVGRILDARPGMNQTFEYDVLDRLARVKDTVNYPPAWFTYDPRGNRTTVPGVSTYGYNDRDQLIAQNGAAFEYDDNGNLRVASGTTFEYSPDNQLESSTTGNAVTNYRYDADGWRVLKKAAITNRFARGPKGELLTEFGPSQSRDYVYVAGRLIGALTRPVGNGGPDVNRVAPTPGAGGSLNVEFEARAGGANALASATLHRAPQAGGCAVTDATGCVWTSVDAVSAPAGVLEWHDDASLSDAPPAGAYVYTVRVADVVGATGAGAVVAFDSSDASPDPFSFVDQTGVAPGTAVLSNIVAVTGLAGAIPIGVSGGTYRICGDGSCSTAPAFTGLPATITNGMFVQVQATSAATLGATTAVTLSIGSGLDVWTVTTSEQDPDPDPFSFVNQTAVPLSTARTSNIVQVTGLQGTIPVSIANGAGSFRVCADASCATSPAFAAQPSSLTNGAFLQVRVTSSASHSTAVSTAVSVGSYSTTWTVTTDAEQDVTPDPFDFVNQGGLPLGAVVSSAILQITGITGSVPVSVSGDAATFRVCPDAVCTGNPGFGAASGTITNGQYVQLRLTASAAFATAKTATLTVGTRSDGWTVTTVAQDTTPNSFGFTNVTGAALGATVASSTAQVSGITGAVPVSVAGGNQARFRVCPEASCSGVAFQTAASTITNGQYLGLQQVASATNGTTVIETVTVGTFSTGWSVTTVPEPCAGSPAPGTTCGDGSKFVGYAPSTGTKLYATATDYPGAQQFAWPQTLWGGTDGANGLANTNGLAAQGNYHAANACFYLTAHGKSDWYLPAPQEWNMMDPHRAAIGGFEPDDTSYWTSAEEVGPDWSAGIYHVLGSYFNGYTGMGIGLPIRCVRRD